MDPVDIMYDVQLFPLKDLFFRCDVNEDCIGLHSSPGHVISWSGGSEVQRVTSSPWAVWATGALANGNQTDASFSLECKRLYLELPWVRSSRSLNSN